MILFWKSFYAIIVFALEIVLAVCIERPYEGLLNDDIKHDGSHIDLDFSHFVLTRPKIFHSSEKHQISTSKQEKSAFHRDTLVIVLSTKEGNYTLDLLLNKELIGNRFSYGYEVNGKHVMESKQLEDIELCHYHGKVRGKIGSWAALSTCDGVSGVFYDGNEMHYIEKAAKRMNRFLHSHLNQVHNIYKGQHLVTTNKTCGFGAGIKSNIHASPNSRFKRQTFNKINGPYNSNIDSRYLELLLVVDNGTFVNYGSNKEKTIKYCKDIANIINALYMQLNIFVALIGVVIWTESDAIDLASNGDTTLTNFLYYRKTVLNKYHPNDNAQLLTNINFDGGVVGKALKGPICTHQYSGGVNAVHSSKVGLVAATVAHEMGHNFGMEHDTNECYCPEERCIMASSSSSLAPKHWSNCSIEALVYAFKQGMDHCLKNKPKSLFQGPMCGNTFVEPGEQCDCGLPKYCDNKCCNATSCTLFANATCGTGLCCDLNTCTIKTAGTECRHSVNECDLPEYCTGSSEYCPSNTYKMNTHTCITNESYCYNGFCSSKTDQCKLLWGVSAETSHPQCYTQLNIKGERSGNCGYDLINETYASCTLGNAQCGLLHCKHLNERVEYGLKSTAQESHNFINVNTKVIPCRTVTIDLGTYEIAPGMVPDGAACGANNMCVNQTCHPIANLRALYECKDDCNGNGWCNNLGHCHCKDGFAPPDCVNLGLGGSVDSGPAADPNAGQKFVNGMFIVFLGIIPGLALLSLLFCYMKRNGLKLNTFKPPTAILHRSPKKPPFQVSSIKKPEDNHSLLHEEPPKSISAPKNESDFFGHFKGFTLSPISSSSPSSSNAIEPKRKAPNPPIIPKTHIVNRSIAQTTQNSDINPTVLDPKPIISSPILKGSTCTAKELISPLKHIPVRTAPDPPVPLKSSKLQDDVVARHHNEKNISSLTRIVSMLRPNDKMTKQQSEPITESDVVLSKSNQIKAHKFTDKRQLRNVEISNPIPQNEIDIGVKTLPLSETKNSDAVVMRTQSMKGGAMNRPIIPTFGSMRQVQGYKRPVSISTSSGRPKSPPPPRPSDGKSSADYKLNQYDDCLNRIAPLAQMSDDFSPTDNIYDVIEEESPEKSSHSVCQQTSSHNDSMELLGEIVSEIQSRNEESIYSSSTLNRNRKKYDTVPKPESDYVNVSHPQYKVPESVYSNLNAKSSASSSSGSYILPTNVSKPIVSSNTVRNEPKRVTSFNSFARPNGPRGPLACAINHSTTTKNSTSTSDPKSSKNQDTNRPLNNSPDLVTSCSRVENKQTPDIVLSDGVTKKPQITKAKPNLDEMKVKQATIPISKKGIGFLSQAVHSETKKSSLLTKDKNRKSVTSSPTKNQNSVLKRDNNVTLLQKKFENKSSTTVSVPKNKV